MSTKEAPADIVGPCPFCGSADAVLTTDADRWPVVQCRDCGATGPCIKLSGDETVAQWNRRAALSERAAESARPAAPVFKNMPNPTPMDLVDPLFEAIWQAAKSWDVNAPEHYNGYCGFNGSHVMLILNKIRALYAHPTPERAAPRRTATSGFAQVVGGPQPPRLLWDEPGASPAQPAAAVPAQVVLTDTQLDDIIESEMGAGYWRFGVGARAQDELRQVVRAAALAALTPQPAAAPESAEQQGGPNVRANLTKGATDEA